MRRVAIIGNAGSGKSTLSRELGKITGLPVVHLDVAFWGRGWVQTPTEQWRERQRSLFAAESWIADGNYGSSLDVRLPLADTVVLLEMPRQLCVWRVLRRSLGRRPRSDLPAGCVERLDLSFLRWVWGYPRRSRPRVLAAIEEHARDAEVRVLRTRPEVRAFVDEVRTQRAGE